MPLDKISQAIEPSEKFGTRNSSFNEGQSGFENAGMQDMSYGEMIRRQAMREELDAARDVLEVYSKMRKESSGMADDFARTRRDRAAAGRYGRIIRGPEPRWRTSAEGPASPRPSAGRAPRAVPPKTPARSFAEGGYLHHPDNDKAARTGGFIPKGGKSGDKNVIFANRGEVIVNEANVKKGAKNAGMSVSRYAGSLVHGNPPVRKTRGNSFKDGGYNVPGGIDLDREHDPSKLREALKDVMKRLSKLENSTGHGGSGESSEIVKAFNTVRGRVVKHAKNLMSGSDEPRDELDVLEDFHPAEMFKDFKRGWDMLKKTWSKGPSNTESKKGSSGTESKKSANESGGYQDKSSRIRSIFGDGSIGESDVPSGGSGEGFGGLGAQRIAGGSAEEVNIEAGTVSIEADEVSIEAQSLSATVDKATINVGSSATVPSPAPSPTPPPTNFGVKECLNKILTELTAHTAFLSAIAAGGGSHSPGTTHGRTHSPGATRGPGPSSGSGRGPGLDPQWNRSGRNDREARPGIGIGSSVADRRRGITGETNASAADRKSMLTGMKTVGNVIKTGAMGIEAALVSATGGLLLLAEAVFKVVKFLLSASVMAAKMRVNIQKNAAQMNLVRTDGMEQSIETFRRGMNILRKDIDKLTPAFTSAAKQGNMTMAMVQQMGYNMKRAFGVIDPSALRQAVEALKDFSQAEIGALVGTRRASGMDMMNLSSRMANESNVDSMVEARMMGAIGGVANMTDDDVMAKIDSDDKAVLMANEAIKEIMDNWLAKISNHLRFIGKLLVGIARGFGASVNGAEENFSKDEDSKKLREELERKAAQNAAFGGSFSARLLEKQQGSQFKAGSVGAAGAASDQRLQTVLFDSLKEMQQFFKRTSEANLKNQHAYDDLMVRRAMMAADATSAVGKGGYRDPEKMNQATNQVIMASTNALIKELVVLRGEYARAQESLEAQLKEQEKILEDAEKKGDQEKIDKTNKNLDGIKNELAGLRLNYDEKAYAARRRAMEQVDKQTAKQKENINNRESMVATQKDLIESIGAPFEYVIECERRMVALSKEKMNVAAKELATAIQNNEEGAGFEKKKLAYQKAQAEVVKATFGAQRSALEKMLGQIVGTFSGSGGIFGPDSEIMQAFKYGQGYYKSSSGMLARAGGNAPDGYQARMDVVNGRVPAEHGDPFTGKMTNVSSALNDFSSSIGSNIAGTTNAFAGLDEAGRKLATSWDFEYFKTEATDAFGNFKEGSDKALAHFQAEATKLMKDLGLDRSKVVKEELDQYKKLNEDFNNYVKTTAQAVQDLINKVKEDTEASPDNNAQDFAKIVTSTDNVKDSVMSCGKRIGLFLRQIYEITLKIAGMMGGKNQAAMDEIAALNQQHAEQLKEDNEIRNQKVNANLISKDLTANITARSQQQGENLSDKNVVFGKFDASEAQSAKTDVMIGKANQEIINEVAYATSLKPEELTAYKEEVTKKLEQAKKDFEEARAQKAAFETKSNFMGKNNISIVNDVNNMPAWVRSIGIATGLEKLLGNTDKVTRHTELLEQTNQAELNVLKFQQILSSINNRLDDSQKNTTPTNETGKYASGGFIRRYASGGMVANSPSKTGIVVNDNQNKTGMVVKDGPNEKGAFVKNAEMFMGEVDGFVPTVTGVSRNKDSVLSLLTPGEMVLNADQQMRMMRLGRFRSSGEMFAYADGQTANTPKAANVPKRAGGTSGSGVTIPLAGNVQLPPMDQRVVALLDEISKDIKVIKEAVKAPSGVPTNANVVPATASKANVATAPASAAQKPAAGPAGKKTGGEQATGNGTAKAPGAKEDAKTAKDASANAKEEKPTAQTEGRNQGKDKDRKGPRIVSRKKYRRMMGRYQERYARLKSEEKDIRGHLEVVNQTEEAGGDTGGMAQELEAQLQKNQERQERLKKKASGITYRKTKSEKMRDDLAALKKQEKELLKEKQQMMQKNIAGYGTPEEFYESMNKQDKNKESLKQNRYSQRNLEHRIREDAYVNKEMTMINLMENASTIRNQREKQMSSIHPGRMEAMPSRGGASIGFSTGGPLTLNAPKSKDLFSHGSFGEGLAGKMGHFRPGKFIRPLKPGERPKPGTGIKYGTGRMGGSGGVKHALTASYRPSMTNQNPVPQKRGQSGLLVGGGGRVSGTGGSMVHLNYSGLGLGSVGFNKASLTNDMSYDDVALSGSTIKKMREGTRDLRKKNKEKQKAPQAGGEKNPLLGDTGTGSDMVQKQDETNQELKKLNDTVQGIQDKIGEGDKKQNTSTTNKIQVKAPAKAPAPAPEQTQKKATGGKITGGPTTGDQIPIMANAGEWVMTPGQMGNLGDALGVNTPDQVFRIANMAQMPGQAEIDIPYGQAEMLPGYATGGQITANGHGERRWADDERNRNSREQSNARPNWDGGETAKASGSAQRNASELNRSINSLNKTISGTNFSGSGEMSGQVNVNVSLNNEQIRRQIEQVQRRPAGSSLGGQQYMV